MNKLQYRTEGRFNLLGHEKSAQYVFQFREDAPKELQRSFLLDLDEDGNFNGSALAVAHELQSVINSYFLNSNKPKINAVVEYLELWSEKDEYDGLKLEREKLTKKLLDVENKLGGYEPEEWDNWKPEATETTEPA